MRCSVAPLALIIFGACRTGSVQVHPAASNEVTPLVLEQLCSFLGEDRLGPSPVHVALTFREIVTGDVLVALAFAMGRDPSPADLAPAEELARSLRTTASPAAVTLPHRTRCAFTAAAPAGELPVVLELSTPFSNPYAASGAGVVLRLSLAGQARTWYFAELRRNARAWAVSRVLLLPMND